MLCCTYNIIFPVLHVFFIIEPRITRRIIYLLEVQKYQQSFPYCRVPRILLLPNLRTYSTFVAAQYGLLAS